jgi:hypothetical protein
MSSGTSGAGSSMSSSGAAGSDPRIERAVQAYRDCLQR